MISHLKSIIKKIILNIANLLGIIRLFSYINRYKVAILCFHSNSTADENLFWPGVFLSPAKTQELLDYFKKSHYQIVSLEQAKQHLRGEIKIKYPIVLTIDDGWYPSTQYLIPEFIRFEFPCTLYVTTYYVIHPIPIVNVIVLYMLWKTSCKELSFVWDDQSYHFVLKDGLEVTHIAQIEEILKNYNDDQKVELIQIIGHALQVDADSMIKNRFFNLASIDELKKLNQSPLVNIQLHSHKHTMPENFELLKEEILINRHYLGQCKDERALVDFCYPCGIWRKSQCDDLKTLGIESVTSLEGGLNAHSGNLMHLKRITITDNKSILELKGQLSGFI